MCPTSRWGRSAKSSVDGDKPCNVMVPRPLVMLAAVWTNNASMSSSCCSVTSLIVTPLSRLLALPGLLLPKTSSMLVGADARVWPMLCAIAACGAFVRQGNAVAW